MSSTKSELSRLLLVLTAFVSAFGQASLTTAQIAKRVSPSVVVITGKTDSGDVLGSGFVISKEGKIVTNLHVIKEMKSGAVQTANGDVFDSISVLAIDARRDLAIIQVPGFNLPVLEFGNSDTVTVGEPVVLVGTPRGLEGTVTAGILSSVRDSGEGFKVLQTDAAMNAGNSGGPLVDNKAQVIGVASFKLGSAEGLNFAIPINYTRGLLATAHNSMTLQQMRQMLTTLPKYQTDNGPSLKQTLDWLREKMSLSTGQYLVAVSEGFSLGRGRSKLVTQRLIPERFESCTIVFHDVEEWIWEKYPMVREVHTTRHTIPLGALTDLSISRLNEYIKDPAYANVWAVFLQANSKIMLDENWSNVLDIRENDDGKKRNMRNENVKTVCLSFNDESIAKRVLEAFKHATVLCNAREAF